MALGSMMLFVAVVIVSVSAVSGLFFSNQCWVCTGGSVSAWSVGCDDASQLETNVLAQKASGCNYCKKYVFTLGSIRSVTRTCEQDCTSSSNVFCCTGNLCNSATKRQRSTLTLIAALSVALYSSMKALIG